MNYKPSEQAQGNTFAVPNALVDNFIKLANPKHLSVLLWVLRHADTPKSAETIAEELHFDKALVNEAIFFWIDNGFIVPAGGCETDKPAKPEKAPLSVCDEAAPEKKKTGKKLSSSMASDEEILQRAKESAEFKFLLQKCQQIYGRTISKAERSMLLSLVDYQGLPVEVILMLIQYAVSSGRTGTNYIHTVGINWSEEGIRTLEQAEERIETLQQTNKLWNSFVSQAGIPHRNPTKKQEALFKKWTGEWKLSVEIITVAYEAMIDSIDKVNYNYLDKILTTWHEAGVQTLEHLRAFEEKKSNASKAESTGAPSFSVDKFNAYLDSIYLNTETKEEA